MDTKPIKKPESGRRYVADIHLRITKEEYSILSQKSKDFGCNISAMLRHLAFEDSSILAKNKAQNDTRKSTLLAVKSIRETFRKLAEDYRSYVENYKKFAAFAMENLAPEVVLNQSIRTAKSLIDITLLTQKEINNFLHEFGQNETHTITRDTLKELPDIPEAVTAQDEKKTKKYIYMERVSVIGNLEADATTYVATDGTEKMRARVVVERTRGKKTKKVFYNVYAVKNKAFEYLKKGKSVYVEGDFDENDEGEKKVFADIIKLIES